MLVRFAARVALAVSLLACGGTTVIDPGSGGAASTSSSNNASTSSNGGSGAGCSEHGDCPGGLCIYTTGLCAPACTPEQCDPCGPTTVCDRCATSSCPGCLDCGAACVPIGAGQCDADNDCETGDVCLWEHNECARECSASACDEPNDYCAPCVTGSCCGCDDCVATCIPF
jgi:hypothetical protein